MTAVLIIIVAIIINPFNLPSHLEEDEQEQKITFEKGYKEKTKKKETYKKRVEKEDEEKKVKALRPHQIYVYTYIPAPVRWKKCGYSNDER